MNYRFGRWIIFMVSCVLLVPILIYVSGGFLVGPYEGESGLLGLVTNIYGDALTGTLSTWFLLLSPMLLVLIWSTCAWMHRNINSRIAKNT